jgi:hypothetical protein
LLTKQALLLSQIPILPSLKRILTMLLSGKNSWFKSNLLSLYFDKTHFLQLITKNNQENDMQILHENK